MLNSVFVIALALVILLIVALPAAYCLSRFKFKGSKFLNAAFMGNVIKLRWPIKILASEMMLGSFYFVINT